MSGTDSLKTYRGNCHCGNFVFEIQTPEITSVTACNCSICVRKAYLWVFPGRDNYKVVKGDEDSLTSYAFAGKNMDHKFCGQCGIAVLARDAKGTFPPEMALAINARVLQDFDVWTVKRENYDGQSLGSPYESPEHKGPLPTAEVDNGKVHTGSCHCGKLTIAVKVPPLDKNYPGVLAECNCSICSRGGYLWTYSLKEQVVLSGAEEDTGLYHFGRGLLNKTFCRTCGVHMTNQYRPVTPERLANFSDFDKSWIPMAQKNHPVNVRVLHGVDIDELPAPERRTNTKDMEPSYENP